MIATKAPIAATETSSALPTRIAKAAITTTATTPKAAKSRRGPD